MGPLTRSGDRLARLLPLLTLTVCATYAQTLPVSGSCVVTAVPPQVRAEGLTERMGDIVLQCSGSNPGAVLSGNLSVFLPVNVTNRVDSSNLTRDAILSVDYGNGFVPTGIAGLVSNTSVAFNGVSITVPPSGKFSIKISNIRANVYQTAGVSPQPLQAQITFSSFSSIPVNQSQLVVANPQIGLYTSLYSAGITCTGSQVPDTVTLSNLFAAGTRLASTRLTEGFANAFLPRDAAAGEDNGTRFLITYSGFPSNAQLFVPDFVAGSDALAPTSGGNLGLPPAVGQYTPGSRTLLLARVFGADANGAGGQLALFPSTPTLNFANPVTLSNGSGYAVYEVVDANPALQESAQFPTFIGLPAVTSAAVAQESASFAPVSGAAAASTNAPITRFAVLSPPSDCRILGDCGAKYFPQLSVPTSPILLTAVAGGDMTSHNGYIPINNAGGGFMTWTASVSYLSGGTGWLNLSSTSGQNFGSILVTANAKNLAAGTYQASIGISSGVAGTATVPVTLTVTAPTTPPPSPTPAPSPAPTPTVVVSKVVNSATFDATPLVAGSLGTVMGSHLSGKNVSVTFDGASAALLYNSDTQINLQVPAAVGGKSAASMVVTVDGTSSAPMQVVLSPAWPSVFANGILNQDNSVNSNTAAATAGSVLQIFATGIPSGGIVSAQIAGHKDLIPLYAGDAPTVTGVQQVNVAVPDDVDPGSTQLILCASTGGQQFCSAAAPLVVQ